MKNTTPEPRVPGSNHFSLHADTLLGRREFLKASGLTLASLLLTPSLTFGADDAASARKPNIIFILADDAGLADIGCYGGDGIKTPNIDALAQGGIRFDRCYTVPICGPSRCQLLTGRYPFRTGLIHNNCDSVISPKREIMIPTVLNAAGYQTAQVGKWGQLALGPAAWGFNESLHYPGNGVYTRRQSKTYTRNGQEQELQPGVYLPDVMHDFTVDFITRNKDNPFFVYYSMSHIHSPIVPTPDSKANGNRYRENIEYMDKLVGKLVAELDRLKLRENTLIFFAGDNGTVHDQPATIGGRPVFGSKGTMKDGGGHVPMIANWPGTIAPNQARKDLIDFSDLFPTMTSLASGKLPDNVIIDGQNFHDLLLGKSSSPRQWVYVEMNGNAYVRDDQWKLTNTGKLFDMKEAPFAETLIPDDTTDPQAQAARTRLQAILATHPARPGDPKQNNKKWMDPANDGA